MLLKKIETIKVYRSELDFIFTTAALTVLCSALVAGKVLVTHQCFGFFSQDQHCLSNIPSIKGLGVGKILDAQLSQQTQINQRGILYDVSSDIKAKERRRKRGSLLFTMFAFQSSCYACWNSFSQEVAAIACQWEVNNKPISFLFACVHTNIHFSLSKLSYHNLWLCSISFSLPCSAGQGSDGAAW